MGNPENPLQAAGLWESLRPTPDWLGPWKGHRWNTHCSQGPGVLYGVGSPVEVRGSKRQRFVLVNADVVLRHSMLGTECCILGLSACPAGGAQLKPGYLRQILLIY